MQNYSEKKEKENPVTSRQFSSVTYPSINLKYENLP